MTPFPQNTPAPRRRSFPKTGEVCPDAPNQVEPPWADCKVAYGIDNVNRFERAMDRTDDFAGLLPPGWHLCETDASGARYVAVFRVEGMLTVEDGTAVLRLLARHGGYREKRRRSAPAQKAPTP